MTNIEAALDCLCGCHPRAGDQHQGDNCRCQLSKEDAEERGRKAWEKFQAIMAPMWAEQSAVDKERDIEFVAAAEKLGVIGAAVRVQASPLVVVGTYRHVGFRLRERHGDFDIVVSEDELTPEDHEITDVTWVIADGTDDELGDNPYVGALQLCVEAINQYLGDEL